MGECHRDNRGRKRERRDVGQTARRLKIVREILLLIQALIIEGGIKLQLLRDIIAVILRRQAVFFVVHIPEDPAVDPVGIMRYVLVVVEIGDDLRNGVEGEKMDVLMRQDEFDEILLRFDLAVDGAVVHQEGPPCGAVRREEIVEVHVGVGVSERGDVLRDVFADERAVRLTQMNGGAR